MSAYPRPEDYRIYEGRSFGAEWYYTAGGAMPALEYYGGLTDLDQRRLDQMIMFFCDQPFGKPLPKTMYRIEDPENKIYAFKPRGERFFNFTTAGRKVILTNAYHKHSQKMTRLDLDQLAISTRYREDYLRRMKEGTYYER